MAAGSYRSTSLTPPVRYDIADDMAAFVLEDSLDSFGPFGYENLADPTITFVEFAGLPEPAKVPKHEHPTDPPLVAIESDADLDGFFSDTPGLVLLDSGADDAGSWWDFTAHTTEGNGYTCPYGDNCFNIAFVDELGYFIMGEDWTARLWRIEGESGVIYAWLQALNDDFDEGLAFATPLLDGLTVG